MSPLHELQAAIANSVLHGTDRALAALIRGDGLGFDRRLQVYRNNTFNSLTAALKDTFPVVCKLVDERFFDYAAHHYIPADPPTAPRLAEYGGGFAGFFAIQEQIDELLPHGLAAALPYSRRAIRATNEGTTIFAVEPSGDLARRLYTLLAPIAGTSAPAIAPERREHRWRRALTRT